MHKVRDYQDAKDEDPDAEPEGYITEMPTAFNEYVGDNAEKIQAAIGRGTAPYWVRDNAGYISVAMGGEDVPASSATVVRETSKTSSSTITPAKNGGGGNTTPPTEPPTATSGGFDDNNPFSPAAYTPERKANAIYPDTPKQADNILRAKCGEIWRNLSEDAKKALHSYTGLFFERINNGLRGIETMTRNTIERIKHIESAIDKSVLDRDMILRRDDTIKGLWKFGVSKTAKIENLTEEDMRTLIGKEGKEDAFWSCGSSKISGHKGNREWNIEFIVYAPKGSKGMYMEPFSQKGGNKKIGKKWDGKSKQENFGAEAETLLQRGGRYRVTNIIKKEKGWQVYVDLIGQEPSPLD